MDAQKEKTNQQVAEHCSSYCPCGCNSEAATNSTSTKKVSCTNCKHFDSDHHCRLDLYNKIISEYDFQ